jgi:hypothetical protein
LNLVERHTEPGDARIVRVRLTEEGRARAAAIGQLWDDVEAELLQDFDGKERKRLRKLLRRVARNLAEASGADSRDLDAPDEDLDELGPSAVLPVAANA